MKSRNLMIAYHAMAFILPDIFFQKYGTFRETFIFSGALNILENHIKKLLFRILHEDY